MIVVDNGSTDGTPAFIAERHPKVKLIANSANLGFSAANNQGLKLASGRYRVLLNPDTLVLDRTLDRLVDHLDAHPQVGVVGAKMVNADGKPQRYETWYPSLLTYLINSAMLWIWGDRGSQDVDYVSGACLMIRQETMQQIGLLDENIFMFAEDVDWCLRAKRAGWRIYHHSGASVIHKGGAVATRDLAARVFNTHQAKLYFFKKYYGRLSYVLLKAIMFLESVAKVLFDVVTYAVVDGDRKAVKRGRVRGYMELVRHLRRPPTFVTPARWT